MRRVCVRELKPYSFDEIAMLMGSDESDALLVVETLMLRGVTKLKILNSEHGEGGEEQSKPTEFIQFCFVGVAVIKSWVFVCYPKYYRESKPSEYELRQIFKVIRRQKATESVVFAADRPFYDDRLVIMVRLLELYNEQGSYTNYEEVFESNGLGRIEWTRTINQHTPLVLGGVPIYVEYDTRKIRRDESDFITRLHHAVLTECSNFLNVSGIADLLSLNGVDLSRETSDDLGDLDQLRWAVARERASQFVTWKQEVLDLLAYYLDASEVGREEKNPQCFGTSGFYHVWELACKEAFADQLDVKLDGLNFSLNESWTDKGHKRLIDIVPRPKWECQKKDGYEPCGEVDTLVPDIITFLRSDNCQKIFCIFDAKYYTPSCDGGICMQPGVESITKQFLYQASYRNFVIDHGFGNVINAFLVPTTDDEPSMVARVSFPGVLTFEEEPFSNYVEMWAVPACKVFDCYIRGITLELSSMFRFASFS